MRKCALCCTSAAVCYMRCVVSITNFSLEMTKNEYWPYLRRGSFYIVKADACECICDFLIVPAALAVSCRPEKRESVHP